MTPPPLQAVANLEAWLTGMRGNDGYGGPVVHWWQNCLAYTGAGLDWRYEGVIQGYLTLWQRTGNDQWLAKAVVAGDDLVRGQLPSGHFRNSSFELNPATGGRPHEAAAVLGLLKLTHALQTDGQTDAAHLYQQTAEKNLTAYYIDRLWDETEQYFRDHPQQPVFVCNKVGTLAETLFAWADVRRDDEPIVKYALPALNKVRPLQIADGPLAGALPQGVRFKQARAMYFPYYIARCVPAFLRAYEFSNDEAWLAAAQQAMAFVHRHLRPDGSLPQILYPKGQNVYPQWLAPLGDILRIADQLAAHGVQFDWGEMDKLLIDSQLVTGGVPVGRGFGAQISQRYRPTPPDFRDCIAAVGWADKVWHYWATKVPIGATLPPPQLNSHRTACIIRGWHAHWQETETDMSLVKADKTSLYLFKKGASWAQHVHPSMMWK